MLAWAPMAMFAILVVGAARAGEQANSRQELENTLQVYEQRLAQQQDRVDMIVQKLKATDEQIERRVERVVGYVTKVTDSQASKTKVTRAKQDLFEAIRKNIEFYANERGRRFAELYRPYSPSVKEALAADVQWLNGRIEKRVDQALALVVSLPAEKNLAKSTTHYDDYSKTVKANPAYTHQWYVLGRGGLLRDDACDGLKASIERLKRSNAELERAMNYARTDEARTFVKDQMARNDGLIEKRGTQIEATRLQANPAARELGSKAAEALTDEIADERTDNKKDLAEWTRLKGERDVERSRLLILQDRIDTLRRQLAGTGT